MTKKKLKIGKSWKKLKKAMKNAGKKNKKVDREDAPLVSPPPTAGFNLERRNQARRGLQWADR